MLCAGTASLFRNGAFGALVAFGQLTGGLGKGLAVLSMVTKRSIQFLLLPAVTNCYMFAIALCRAQTSC